VRRGAERGVALVEALAALGVTAIALAGLAATAASAVRHVRLSRDRGTALALAVDQIETLRAGPRDTGRDEPVVGATSFVRTWESAGGRGDVALLDVQVAWADGSVRIATGAFP
jgi:Tfp pilus assembly protein PilV